MPFLILGDLIVLVLITVSGFATHGEVQNISRMPSTLIPLAVGWFLLSPFFGLFDKQHIGKPMQLWRVIIALFAAVPLAAWLRGLWLSAPIQPVFVLVIGGVAVLGMCLWRAIFILWIKWAGKTNG